MSIPLTVSNHPGTLCIEEDEIIDVRLDEEGFLWFEVPMGEIVFGPHDVEQLRRLLNGK